MSLEFNKFAAAVLLAGIVAMFSGFIARQLFHVEPLHGNAYSIAGVGEPVAPTTPTAAPPEPILGLIASADVAKGQALFKNCATCHTDDAGGANKVGPNLWGVVGRPVGSHAGFSYSAAMAAHGGNWTYEELSHFLAAPAKHIPGTKMTYAGLKKVQDRADVIAYLRTPADTEAPLPPQEEIDAEAKAAAGPAETAPAETAPAGAAPSTEPSGTTPAPAPAPAPAPTNQQGSTEGSSEPTQMAASDAQAAGADGVDPALREAIAAADPAAGEKAARVCVTCHSFEAGGPNKVGPNLYGVIGAAFGHLDNYNYSKAFKDAHAAGRVWTYEDLAAYLANPKTFMPGNKMTFAGLKKPADVAAVLAYLRTFHDAAPPLN